jgi:hypothetical protein
MCLQQGICESIVQCSLSKTSNLTVSELSTLNSELFFHKFLLEIIYGLPQLFFGIFIQLAGVF